MCVNPGSGHKGSYAWISTTSATNNNEESINPQSPPAWYETVSPTGTDQTSLFSVLSAATIGMIKKGWRQMHMSAQEMLQRMRAKPEADSWRGKH